MSQIESTRRVRDTTPIQRYPKRTLKNFKFSGYLVLILMLWGGCLSSANAINRWFMIHHTVSISLLDPPKIPVPKPYFQYDNSATHDAILVAYSYDNCEALILSIDPSPSNIQVNTISGGCSWLRGGNPNLKRSFGFHNWGISCNDGWHAELNAAGNDLVCVTGPPPSESCPDGWTYNYYKKECVEPPPPPPIPPESSSKNLGSGPECPSPYVASDTK